MKFRKSSRLSVFDNLRNLSKGDSPTPVSKLQLKVEHRRQQLEKWKQEKEKKKKEAAAQKKKPFIAGVAHSSLRYVPPPPPPKAVPSTSGRVTRSQSARIRNKSKETKAASVSFAPENASFKPPEFKTLTEIPNLAPPKTRRDKEPNIAFDPVVPNTQTDIGKQKRSKSVKQTVVETTAVRKLTERTTKGKLPKQYSKAIVTKGSLQSSSSSEMEQIAEVSPILTCRNMGKSLPATKSPMVSSKTQKKSTKYLTPDKPVPKSESSSEERLRSPKLLDDAPLTPEQIQEEANNMSPCVTVSRGKDNARKEMKKKLDEGKPTF